MTGQQENTEEARSSSAAAESYPERRKVARIHRRYVAPLFSNDQEVVGLPDDAQLIHIRWNAQRDTLDLVVESESFEPVPEGGKYPEINLEVRSV